MESRRIILLIRGYLLGWLDFEYPHPYSKLREDLILAELERQTIIEFKKIQLLRDSSLMSTIAPGNREIMNIASEQYKDLTELALPYLHKEDIITEEKRDAWIEILKEKQRLHDEEVQKNKKVDD